MAITEMLKNGVGRDRYYQLSRVFIRLGSICTSNNGHMFRKSHCYYKVMDV